MTLKAQKREKNSLLFSRYEKDRRSRFNALLDKLAVLLPNYSDSNNGSKWTKAQIIDNAIKFIKSLQSSRQDLSGGDQNDNSSNPRVMKLLKRQNKKLREVLRNEFAPHLSEREFCTLDFNELHKLIGQKRNKENNQNALNDAGDVFVVSTDPAAASSSDHTYSLIVQQEAEVEIGSDVENNDDNEVVVFDIPEEEEQQQPPPVIEEAESQMQPIIIQMATPVQTPFFQPANVLPIQRLTASFPPPNKLPLPRTYSSASTAGLVNVYNNPMVASQPWRLPKEKRKRKRAKKNKEPVISSAETTVVTSVATSTISVSTTSTTTTSVASVSPSVNTQIDSDYVRVSASSSLPKTILATEAEHEVVDLTVENQQPRVQQQQQQQEAMKKSAKTVTSALGSRRAKSSYSIAALCQMSVNIGGDPAAGAVDSMPAAVNSPGVISLNSTESPRATPTPQSPRPPSTSSSSRPPPNLQQSSLAQAPAAKLASGKKVIHELKPITGSNEAPTSPTKSYLTQFPVVKGGQEQPPQPLPQKINAQGAKKAELSKETAESSKSKVPEQSRMADNTSSSKMMNPSTLVPTSSYSSHSLPSMRPPASSQNRSSAHQSEYYQYSSSAPTDFSKQNYKPLVGNNQLQPQQMHFGQTSKTRMQLQQQSNTSHLFPPLHDTGPYHGSYGDHANAADSNFFSVNQLVSHKSGQFQTTAAPSQSKSKATKRASTSSTTSSSSSSRYQKSRPDAQPSQAKDSGKKEDTRGAKTVAKNQSRTTASARPSASSTNAKRSYTAESLLSTQVVDSAVNILSQSQTNVVASSSRTGHHYSSRNDKLPASNPASSRVSEFNWNMTAAAAASADGGHFAPFPSISPSPNLFSQDFGGFDFSTSMFGDMTSTLQGTKSSSGRSKDQSRFVNQQQQHQLHQQVHHQQDFAQQPQDGQQQQQQGIFDANFFSIPGTLTPPSGSGTYAHQDDAYVTFSAPGSSMVSSASAASRGYSKARPQHHVPPQQQQQLDVQQHHHHQQHGGYSSQHQQVLLSSTNNPPPGGTSYMNFNLSTLFPEINVGGGAVPTEKLPIPRAPTSLAPPLPTLPPSSVASGSDFRTSEILPPSIAIFGGHHGAHQMSFSSVPFSTSSFHHTSSNSSINFSLNDQ